MEKYKDSDVELMSILLKLQEQTSPIRMSIGYTCDLNGCGMRVYKL